MKTPEPKVADFLLEQLLLGEIDARDEAWLRNALSAEQIEARLSELRQQNEAFHNTRGHTQTVADIEGRIRVARARSDQKKRHGHGLYVMVPAFAAAAAALFLVLRPPTGSEISSQGEWTTENTTREKGLNAHLVVHRRVGDAAETLTDGARAKPGDVLQVGYVAAHATHGAIVSFDGAGAVTLHFPDQERGSTRLVEEGEQLLTHAYELDAAPAFERFVFVTSTHPIDVKAVLDAAKSLAKEKARARSRPLPLPSSLEQNTLTLVKE